MFEIIEKGNTVFYINNKHKLKLKAEKNRRFISCVYQFKWI